MGKYHYPPPQSVLVQTNIVKAITLDPTYEAKTAQVVLTREDGVLNMSVYRASTSPDALGMFSREDFVRTPQGLERLGKADVKFLPPKTPAGAIGSSSRTSGCSR